MVDKQMRKDNISLISFKFPKRTWETVILNIVVLDKKGVIN